MLVKAHVTENVKRERDVEVEVADSSSGDEVVAAVRDAAGLPEDADDAHPWEITDSEGMDVEYEHGSCDVCDFPLLEDGTCPRCKAGREKEDD
jgi:hypothetical protein